MSVRSAFALTPEYLRTREAGAVKNLMDTGIQLGRRFRALKLWMILRSFGARAIRAAYRASTSELAQLAVVDRRARGFRAARAGPAECRLLPMESPRASDCPMSELDAANEELVDLVNSSGDVFLSHTRLRGRLSLRIAVGHLDTAERHIRRAWELLTSQALRLR